LKEIRKTPSKVFVSAKNSAGATVPHASVLAYGKEYSYGEDGLCVIRRPVLDPMKMKQLGNVGFFRKLFEKVTNEA